MLPAQDRRGNPEASSSVSTLGGSSIDKPSHRSKRPRQNRDEQGVRALWRRVNGCWPVRHLYYRAPVVVPTVGQLLALFFRDRLILIRMYVGANVAVDAATICKHLIGASTDWRL